MAFKDAVLTTVLLLLAMHVHTMRAQCPENCNCYITTEWSRYYCLVNGKNISIMAKRNIKTVSIMCEGFTNFTWSDLPPMHLNYTAYALHFDSCAPRLLQGIHSAWITYPQLHIVEIQMKIDNVLSILDDYRWPDTSPTVPWPPTLRTFSINGYYVPQFHGLSGLKKLFIARVPNFTSVVNDTFKGLDLLEGLTLYSVNQLSSIEVGAFSHTPKLKSISITNEEDSLLTRCDYPFGGWCLGSLHRDKLSRTSLARQLFANLTYLESVDIQYACVNNASDCLWNVLDKDMFAGSSALRTISLVGNEIEIMPKEIFEDQLELKSLDLSDNFITEMPTGIFKTLKKLETLNLNDNSLVTLPNSLLTDLKNLRHLYLNLNIITTIEEFAFQGNINLETLSLEYNRLTPYRRNGRHVGAQENSHFYMLKGLKKLQLSGNRFDIIYNDWRVNLTRLEYLDLSHNRYKSLEIEDLIFQSTNITIDLKDNRITKINLPYASDAYPAQDSNQVVLLDGNQLRCDCELYPLVLRLNGSNAANPEPRFKIVDFTCKIEDLPCILPLSECPLNCSVCKWYSPTKVLEFDCTTTPDTLPKSSSDIKLRIRELTDSISNSSVQILNLTGLSIDYDTAITFKLPKTLKVLDLTNNSLHIPPVELLKTNISLYMSKNPYKCECRYLDELSLLLESKFILDSRDVTCEGGDRIDIATLCRSWWTPTLATGTAIVAVIALLVAIAAIVCYNYSNEIIVYFIYKGICTRYFEDEDPDKEYDAFVSFSHKDLAFIQDELIPKLEDEFKLKLCIHYRDWNIGEFITTQITRSVDSSRKTVIVMSKNFLESMWATVEFNVAHTAALRESKARIIMILLEDVANEPRIPEEIKVYLSTNTYLMWGDSKFWPKLHRALPERKKKFVGLNSIQNIVDNSENQGPRAEYIVETNNVNIRP